ncbi:MAG: DnaA regulatory inactivator Hda [Halieaceae bacterium]|mgnify:CR=1 FL=1|nr:DnaA regulatory inactivator Hda [Halieaceae bacterium]
MTSSGCVQQQLALNIRLRDDATLDNFCGSVALQPILTTLRAQRDPSGEPIVYLYGPADTGKSHLLQAACHMVEKSALYLPLADLHDFSPEEVVRDVELLDLVCLDDVHSVLQDESWELALFHLFNRARQHGCKLLVSGNAAPRALSVDLPDLQSRLSWGIVYQLTVPDDEVRKAILCFRADQRGLSLSVELATYIVSRAPRALGQLLALLEQLDKASLAQQRVLTIPFVKSVLGW